MKTSVNIHQSFEIIKKVNGLVQGKYKKKTQIFPTKIGILQYIWAYKINF